MNKLGTTTTLWIEPAKALAREDEEGQSLGAELVFRVCTHWRYSALTLAPIFSFAAGVCVWSHMGRDAVVELATLAVLSFLGLTWRRRTELRISQEGLTASGDLGGFRRGHLRLNWNRVRELHYGPGGGEEIGGLYAREGNWCSRCILPRVTEAQADEVIGLVTQYRPALSLATRSTHMAVSWPAMRPNAGPAGVSLGRVDAR